MLPGLRVQVQQALHPAAPYDMLLHYLHGILGLHLSVESIVRYNLDHRPFLAEAEASRSDHVHTVRKTFFFQQFLDFPADKMT